VAYIASWLKVLNHDRQMVIVAAAQAQRAADYIQGESAAEGAHHGHAEVLRGLLCRGDPSVRMAHPMDANRSRTISHISHIMQRSSSTLTARHRNEQVTHVSHRCSATPGTRDGPPVVAACNDDPQGCSLQAALWAADDAPLRSLHNPPFRGPPRRPERPDGAPRRDLRPLYRMVISLSFWACIGGT
jgi:hypothetical protein